LNINKLLRKSYINFKGWSTKRRIVVIESDDWGSVRTTNQSAYQKLIEKGLPLQNSRYTRYDSLENPRDLERLFDVLSKHKDINGHYPCITANSLVANPDFERIRDSGLTNYYYETLSDSYKKHSYETQMQSFWETGISENLFYPQFHGREHLHPSRWLNAINSSTKERLCFDFQVVPGIPLGGEPRQHYMAAFDYYNVQEKREIEDNLRDGLSLFKNIFGFVPKSFVASQSISGDHINEVLKRNGVLFHQNGQRLLPSMESDRKNAVVNHLWGDRDVHGLIFWRRNVTFEPSKNTNYDWISSCLEEVSNAFFFGKPAVINSHRVNYIGSLSEENQTNSLTLLDELLERMVSRWPNVEFMNSEQLGEEISLSL
jgi:hypothetical protein